MANSLRDVPRLATTADGRWEIGRGVAYRAWPVLRPLAQGWRQGGLARTSLAAVVGSLGKTTTVRCIAAALGEPEPLLPFNQFGLLALNLLAIKPWRKRAVVEVGISRPGEMAVYAQLCRPDVVVVTAIASDHLKHMNSLDVTAREKAAMLAGLRPGGTAVLNGDDARVLAMKAPGPRVMTFGFGEHRVRCLQATLSRKTGLSFLDDPLLQYLRRAERLAAWRTRWLTGQYIAVQAVRRSPDAATAVTRAGVARPPGGPQPGGPMRPPGGRSDRSPRAHAEPQGMRRPRPCR